jgi:hypothetical protein
MDDAWLSRNQVAPLAWAPWYLSALSNTEGAAWVWPVLQDVCQLPDPQGFPVFEHEWDPGDLAILRRYAAVSERLVATSVFNSNARARISLLKGTVSMAAPADDLTVGFSTLLRQLFKHTEEASFDRARKVLAAAAHRAAADDAGSVLGRWKTAHQTILKRHLGALLEEMAHGRGLLGEDEHPSGARPFVSEDIAPGALLEVFLYGDLIHWGEHRDTVSRWQADAATAALMEINMRADAQTLAHFYCGFAGIVRLVLAEEGADQTCHLTREPGPNTSA